MLLRFEGAGSAAAHADFRDGIFERAVHRQVAHRDAAVRDFEVGDPERRTRRRASRSVGRRDFSRRGGIRSSRGRHGRRRDFSCRSGGCFRERDSLPQRRKRWSAKRFLPPGISSERRDYYLRASFRTAPRVPKRRCGRRRSAFCPDRPRRVLRPAYSTPATGRCCRSRRAKPASEAVPSVVSESRCSVSPRRRMSADRRPSTAVTSSDCRK